MNDHTRIQLLQLYRVIQEQYPTNAVGGFGHFVNATLLNKTRSFIIATLKGKINRNRYGIISQR